jgi:hypothetical protein
VREGTQFPPGKLDRMDIHPAWIKTPYIGVEKMYQDPLGITISSGNKTMDSILTAT